MTLFPFYENKQGTQNNLPKCINILFFFITLYTQMIHVGLCTQHI